MKKTIALLLCLVMCVFAFASCNKKNNNASTTASTTSKPASTAEPSTAPGSSEPTSEEMTTLPPHVHTRDDEYSIIEEATCSKKGSRAILCTECGEPIEETIEEIDINPNAHVVDANDWNIVQEPTIFGDGLKTATCTACHAALEVVIKETYNEWKYTTETTDEHSIKINPVSLRGEGHYYPDASNGENGQDYIVEFSFLWNDTLQKLSKKNAAGEDNKLHQVLCGEMHSKAFFWMALKDGAKGADSGLRGAFEYTDCMQTVEVGPAGMSLDASGNIAGGVYANFPNIGGADQANPEWGWHRLAFVYHEELVNEDALKADTEAGATAAQYLIEYSCYIDGTLIYKHSNRSDANFHASDAVAADNRLFSAASDGLGGIIYTDNEMGTFTPVRIKPVRTDADNAYVVIADFVAHVEETSADPAFKQAVTKVATPDDNVYTTEDGTEINAKIFYQLVIE